MEFSGSESRMLLIPFERSSSTSSIGIALEQGDCCWLWLGLVCTWLFALVLSAVKVEGSKEICFSSLGIYAFVWIEGEKIRQRQQLVGDRHRIIDNQLLPIHDLSSFGWLASDVDLVNVLRQSLSIFNLGLISLIVKRRISVEFGKRGFGSNVNINFKTFHLGGALIGVLDFLDSSSSHDNFMDVMGSKLFDKHIPVLLSQRVTNSVPEIFTDGSRLEEVQ